MVYWILLAVVVTTAIFLSLYVKMKQNELRKTEELLIQFIDQFEEQYEQLAAKVEEQNNQMEAKYDQLRLLINSYRTDVLDPDVEPMILPNTEPALDPLQLHERFHPIVVMVEEGMSIDEIARKTGKGKGEVSLILELLEKKDEK